MNDRIFVTKSFMPPMEEYVEMIKSLWQNVWLTNNGSLHNELEIKLKEYLKVENATLLVNGHSALTLAIKALNLKGEIITTPFTFASTTHAIVNNGITPVFCDIDPVTYTIDANKIESLITEKTSAILAVHVYGNVCNVEKIEAIARKYNLKVIYDAAHSFGITYKNNGIGTYGDVNMFSMHATKVFHTIEGGLLTYKDSSLISKLKLLRNFGISDEENIIESGINAKMNEFQAAMGLCNLKYIDNEIIKRKNIYDLYKKELENLDGIDIKILQEGIYWNYSYFPLYVDSNKYGMNRNELSDLLKENNIFPRKYFYPLTCDFKCYKNQYKCDVPIAKDVSNNILVLPMYGDLEIENVKRICKLVKDKKR